MPADGDMTVSNTVATKPLEFINYDCEISEEFNDYLKRRNFDKFNSNYNVLSILGCQSSGKSSLLNSVFGLDFDVMNTKLGHSQTTKGLWGVLITPEEGKDGNATIVIDVEGTDSRERGEGRLTFEHRASLLCLAISDCVIINLWYHSLGNLTGSNYGLLKTVMEANLELAEGSGHTLATGEYKTIICFCIRDWFPELAPLDTVREKVVNGYMMDIWNDIKKPESYKNMAMEDLFRIELFGFNHALVHKDEFTADAETLLNEWNTSIRPKVYSRGVPSDGFFYYAKNILNTVKEQNHLDIPTQREMLANIRCQEIKNAVLDAVSENVSAMLTEVHEHPLDDFNNRVMAVVNSSVDNYFESASRYEKGTSVRIGVELVTALLHKIQPVFDAHMSHYCRDLIMKASVRIDKEFALRGKGKSLMVGTAKATEVWPKFTDLCEEIKGELLDSLSNSMASHDVHYTNDSELSVDFAFDRTASTDIFNVTFKNEVDMLKGRHLQALKAQIADIITSGFKVIDETLLECDITSKKYWGDVNALINKAYQTSIDTFKTSYEGIVANSKENEFEYLSFIVLLESTKANLERIESNIIDIISDRFEQFFQYQEYNGEQIPRAWETVTDEFLRQTYAKSKKDALSIVGVLRDCNPPTLEVPKFDLDSIKADHILYRDFNTGTSGLTESKSSLSDDVLVDTVKLCKRRFHELYKTAQKIQSSKSSGVSWKNVPPAFWVALLVCGFNEVLTVLRIVFKAQILIPLLIFVIFFVQYCARTIFGERVDEVLNPIKMKGLSLAYSVSQWFVTTALANLRERPSESGSAQGESAPPDDEDDKDKCQGVVKNSVKKGRRQPSSEDSDSDSTPTKPLQLRGLRNRDPIDLRIAIDLDAAECAKKDIPCWKDSHAGPSSLPARRICVTCGFFGDYKCVSCVTKRITRLSVYYCSNVCYEIHKDHSCGKPINVTMW